MLGKKMSTIWKESKVSMEDGQMLRIAVNASDTYMTGLLKTCIADRDIYDGKLTFYFPVQMKDRLVTLIGKDNISFTNSCEIQPTSTEQALTQEIARLRSVIDSLSQAVSLLTSTVQQRTQI